MKNDSNTRRERVPWEFAAESPAIALRVSGVADHWKTESVSRQIENYGYPFDEFSSGTLSFCDIVHPDDLSLLVETLKAHEKTGTDDFLISFRIRRSDGTPVSMSAHAKSTRDELGRVRFTDFMISNQSALEESLRTIDDHYRRQSVINDILESLHSPDLDLPIQIILRRAGEYLGVSRVLLMKDDELHAHCRVAYEWADGDTPRLTDAFTLDYQKDIPEISDELTRAGRCVTNADKIPSGSAPTYAEKGVLASAVFAVHVASERYGILCFHQCRDDRDWDEGTLGFLHNIADLISTALHRMQHAQRLANSQKVCETVLHNISSYIYATDPETNRLVFANDAFMNDFGADCLGKPCFSVVQGELSEGCADCLMQTKERSSAYCEIYVEKTGDWMAVNATLVPWTDGRPVRLVSAQKITERKLYEDSITKIAFTDPLTGLPNRYRCDIDLESILMDAEFGSPGGYLLFIDMDDFKDINEAYGHNYGDAILVDFAAFLKEHIAGLHGLYRFGGDEFVILLENFEEFGMQQLVDKLLARSRLPWVVIDKQFYCTVSVGVVPFPGGGATSKELLRNADIAMYQAKSMGKNSSVLFTEELSNDSIERIELERRLREAIANSFSGFQVYYQPIMSAKAETAYAAEALLRWFDEDGQVIMPDKFISLSEYLGLIVPLGEFVLREAALFCKRVNDMGRPDFSICVNLSFRQLQQADIVSRIEAILTETGVNFRNITLELTEGIAADNMPRMLLICEALRKKGIRIAMDDFGTGYSSLNNLREMPIDIIKIDRSFLRDVTTDAYSNSFIHLIARLGQTLGKDVCIEGVETKEQLEYCRTTGTSLLQGFYFSRPLPADNMFAALKAGA